MKRGFDFLSKLLPHNSKSIATDLSRSIPEDLNTGIINPKDLPADTPVIILPDREFTSEELHSVIRKHDIIKPKPPQQIEGLVSNPQEGSDTEAITGEVIEPRQHIVLRPEDLTNQAIGMRKYPYPKVKR